MHIRFTLVAAWLAVLAPAAAQDTKSAPGARVYFINLKTGDVVANPVVIQFGLRGMGIAPAGSRDDFTENTGHHHLLVDAKLEGEALTQPIPMDDNHRHFGRGQTEASITLPPGRHTLQLTLADWTHIPHVPPVMSEVITIEVK